MKRPETSFEIKRLVGELSEKIPGIALRTTLMVGFPGETEKDFQELIRFVKNTKFNNMGAFTYYREQGTPSYDFEDQIPEDVKKARYEKLMAVQNDVQQEVLDAFMGAEVETMVDAFVEKTKEDGFLYRGRHYGQAPDVDGITYILSDSELEIGGIYPVIIDKVVGDYDLLGVVSAEDLDSIEPQS
jgi:ribosomal protein S12 methylthiotransferase